MQDTRIEYVKYSATWPEWALTFAGIASFLLFFTIMSKFVTIVPVSGLEDTHKPFEHSHQNGHTPAEDKKQDIQPA
jgi:hypothetical protein